MMNDEDISIAINNERAGFLQGNLGYPETELSHYERSLAAYRRLGDTAKVAHLEARIADVKKYIAARAA